MNTAASQVVTFQQRAMAFLRTEWVSLITNCTPESLRSHNRRRMSEQDLFSLSSTFIPSNLQLARGRDADRHDQGSGDYLLMGLFTAMEVRRNEVEARVVAEFQVLLRWPAAGPRGPGKCGKPLIWSRSYSPAPASSHLPCGWRPRRRTPPSPPQPTWPGPDAGGFPAARRRSSPPGSVGCAAEHLPLAWPAGVHGCPCGDLGAQWVRWLRSV